MSPRSASLSRRRSTTGAPAADRTGAAVSVGLGGGACLVLALTFQSVRAGSSGEAAALAGMAQSVGCLVAAAGPLFLG
ncbi:hypothetical protein AB0H90_25735, partial [Streptomyces paromomycinus]